MIGAIVPALQTIVKGQEAGEDKNKQAPHDEGACCDACKFMLSGSGFCGSISSQCQQPLLAVALQA
jgi:hypothetical protein